MQDNFDFLSAVKSLTASVDFSHIIEKVLRAIYDFSMSDMLNEGVVVGFSGGKDSLLLLICLTELRKTLGFDLRCVHINHMIRGEDADSDEAFSRLTAEALGVPIHTVRVDVPAYAREKKISIELAARELRYEELYRYQKEHSLGCIAVAHNATDNLETVIFNITRGAGTVGCAGIPPVRDSVIRPIIYLTSDEIIGVLEKFSVPYAVDKTNFECDYTRCAIRHKVLPTLCEINPALEGCVSRLSQNLRRDADALDRIAEEIFAENYKDGYLSAEALVNAHDAIKYRLIKMLAGPDCSLQHSQVSAIIARLVGGGAFCITLASGYEFYRDAYKCTVRIRKDDISSSLAPRELLMGENVFCEYGCAVYLSDTPHTVSFSNVYNSLVQVKIPCDIINGKLYVRPRREGDSYIFGGITHKLKKMMIDAKIPKERRASYPVICDGDGILYLPRFSYRNSREALPDEACLYITVGLDD